MKRGNQKFKLRAITAMVLSGGALLPVAGALAQQSGDAVELDTVTVTGEVTDDINIMPTEPVDSVFGFDKSLLETPRSVTSISNEMLEKFNISELDDLVALSPGSFTQSFFGVAGSLDVRGSPGEVYFNGVRRIENPGNYPTPIGASDRIDIVRGPASPIYGPSRIGGYLNFVPKSARAENGAYMKEPKGEFGVTRGSWDKDIIHGEVGGPGEIAGKEFGYYLYAETEDSGSYYENTETDQSIYQASFNMDLTSKTRIEFDGMYHHYEGNQVAGWNRLTQDLIDDGTYITGSPPALDANNDGLIDSYEAGNADLGIFYFGGVGTYSASQVTADLLANPNMNLQNPGTTHIKGSQVLVTEEDLLEDDIWTLYFDIVHDFDNGLTMTNKSFYESLDNVNENAYGFSQFADTWAFEDQLTFSFKTNYGSNVEAAYQFGPSIRYQDFEHGDNFAFEYFDRRDISQASTPLDRRALATHDNASETVMTAEDGTQYILEPFSSHTIGNFTDYGFALLADYTFFKNIHLLGGGRYDYLDVESRCGKMVTATLADSSGCDTAIGEKQTDTDGAFSWSASLSYDIPNTGISPYVTLAKQSTLITGQGGQVPSEIVASGDYIGESKLNEYGVKTSQWNGRIYAALDYFDQKRQSYNAQDTVTNNTTEAKGWEFEFRALLTEALSLTGAYTHMQINNLYDTPDPLQFNFAGAGDLPAGVDPSLMYGGVVNGINFVSDTGTRKAGVPENLYSLYLIYNFKHGALEGLTSTLGMTHVDSVYSGFSDAVKLPAYTLWNAGLSYDIKHWSLGFQVKNLTDERYYRSNFPDLFGSSVVLPELPRNYLASIAYKF